MVYVKDGKKEVKISSSWTGSYEVSDANTYTIYPNERSFKWNIVKMTGLSQADLNQIKNMDYKQMVYLGQNKNKVSSKDSNSMLVENLRSGAIQSYRRVSNK